MNVHFPYKFILLSLLTICSVYVADAQELSFSPTRLFFKGNPAETVTKEVSITNSSKEVYEFITRLGDWKRDSLGTKMYSQMDSLPNSNGKSISLSSTNFTVNPGEKKVITVSMLIPQDSKDHLATNSMLFFTQTNAHKPETEGKGIGIRINLELGVQIFYTPATAKTGEMKFLAFEYEKKKDGQDSIPRLSVKFENTGDVNKDGFVRFELTNKETGEEIKLPPIPIAIMPRDWQWVCCTLDKKIATGPYLAVAILDTGSNSDLKVAEKEIDVKR
jgi:hypothetical protein